MISSVQIEAHGLAKLYPGNRGLHATSFAVDKGELIALVGHNGAGKSTLLQILGNWLPADTGRVTVDGTDLINRRVLVRKIGFAPETPNLFEIFSVEYNLGLFARLFGIHPSRVETTLEEFNILPFRRSRVQDLSKGLKQRVSIGRAMLADPDILLFDEPTSGLDFEMTGEIYRLMQRFHALGKTILFSSHRPEEIRTLATRIMVLHQGSVIFDDSPTAYFDSRVHRDLYT